MALNNAQAGDEIWVATGTYTPTNGTDRAATFQLKNGLALYGGFAGTEATRVERDWQIHLTILSGDIGLPGDNGDNVYHVLTSRGVDGTTILDGFIVRDGHANGPQPQDRGGGMYNEGSSPTVRHILFENNTVSGSGGGMYNTESHPTLTEITFRRNQAGFGGGGLYNLLSNPLLSNVIFEGNRAGFGGGGMYNIDHSSPQLANSLFSGNTALNGGGIYNIDSSNPILAQTTFSRNEAIATGGGMASIYSNPNVENSIFWDNRDTNGGHTGQTAQISDIVNSVTTINNSLIQGWSGGGSNINADPLFSRAPDPGAAGWGTADDDYGNLRLQFTSPAIDSGDNNVVPLDAADLDGDGNTSELLPLDLDGQRRFAGPINMGAYETAYANVNLNKIVRPNTIVTPGQWVTYTIRFANAGPHLATGLRITDIIPLTLTQVSYTSQGPVITPTGAIRYVWRVDDLAPGEAGLITVTGQISPGLTSAVNVVNVAFIGGGRSDPVSGDNGGGPVTVPVIIPRCYARLGSTTYRSADARAVQEAVDAANNGQLIKIAGHCAGVQIRAGLMQTTFISKSLTLRGGYTRTNWLTSNPAANPTTLDAQAGGRVLVIDNSPVARLENLRLMNGQTNGAGEEGGGIYARQSALYLDNSALFNNTVSGAGSRGGGLYIEGDLYLTDSEVRDNVTTSGDGGGLYVTGEATLSGGLFRDNQVLNPGRSGGGLYVTGRLALTGTVFRANQAAAGGSGAAVSGVAVVNGARFENNGHSNTGAGGGLQVTGDLTTTGAIFIDNAALNGGGLHHNNGRARIINNLFARNRAGNAGAALYFNSGALGQAGIIYTTIASPTLNAREGIYLAAGTAHLTNTIIANHETGLRNAGGTASEDYNLFFGNTNDLQGAPITSGGNSLTGDPAFTNPFNDDYHLRPVSAAINRAQDVAIFTDFEGQLRPQGGGFDIGYDELRFLADLVLAKAVMPANAVPGAPVTYTLRFVNQGNLTATNVVLTDIVPSAIVDRNVSSSSSLITDTAVQPAFVWTVQDLFPGDRGLITITGLVSPTLSDDISISNQATIATSVDPNHTNNQAQAILPVQVPRLHFSQANYGLPEGDGPALITLSLTFPNPYAGVTVIYQTADGTATAGQDYPPLSHSLTIPAGQTEIRFTLPITNDAQVEDNETFFLSLNQAVGARLSSPLTATVVITDDDQAGIVIWPTTLNLAEGGPASVYSLTLTSQPRAVVTVTIRAGGQTVVNPPQLIFTPATWNIPQFVSAAAVDDNLIEGPHSDLISHTVTSLDMDYHHLTADQVVVTITDNDALDLRITKSVQPTLARPGNFITYTLQFSNTGFLTATGVVITDFVPGDIAIQQVTGSGILSPGGTFLGGLRWQIEDLAQNQPQTITLVGQVNAALTQTMRLTNTSLIIGAGHDINLANNTSAAGLTVVPLAVTTDLQITKAVQPMMVIPGHLLTYTIIFSNAGFDPATGVIITDVLPDGLTVWQVAHDEVLLTAGTFAAGLVWQIADLPPDQGGAITVTAQVSETLRAAVWLTNTVFIAGQEVDIDLTNNQAAVGLMTQSSGPKPIRVYLPLVLKPFVGAPDLIVETLIAEARLVTVTIKNIGTAPVRNAFWVDVYIDPSPPPSQVNQHWWELAGEGMVWGITTTLQVSETLTLTVGDQYYSEFYSQFTTAIPPGTPVYAQVDSVHLNTTHGGVLETHEIMDGLYNNITHTLSITGTPLIKHAPTNQSGPIPGHLLPPRALRGY